MGEGREGVKDGERKSVFERESVCVKEREIPILSAHPNTPNCTQQMWEAETEEKNEVPMKPSGITALVNPGPWNLRLAPHDCDERRRRPTRIHLVESGRAGHSQRLYPFSDHASRCLIVITTEK